MGVDSFISALFSEACDLLECLLDARTVLVPLLAQNIHIRPSSGQLMPQAVDLGLQVFQPRIWSRRTLSGLVQVHARALELDFQLAPFREEPLDQRLSRLFLLGRHSGTVQAGTLGVGAAPSRRADNAP